MVEIKLLDDELINKIKGIQLKAAHLANDVFAGEYESAFKGRGLEFEEVREYLPGDDVRCIDWNVSARFDKPFIKTYRDERELTIIFMVDVSASAQFGTHRKFKSEIAAEITALLAYTALRNNDRVGLIIFSDHVEHYIPARKGRGHVWRLIKEILAYRSTSRRTDFSASVEFVKRCIKKKAIVFLLSDFQDQHYQSQLKTLGKKHDVIAINLFDAKEVEIPNIGYVEFEDVESGESVLVNTGDARLRQAFAKDAKESLQAQQRFFRSAAIDLMQIETDDSYLDPIIKFFRQRERRQLR
jgi:uncharacterized protein (DUF58 family)